MTATGCAAMVPPSRSRAAPQRRAPPRRSQTRQRLVHTNAGQVSQTFFVEVLDGDVSRLAVWPDLETDAHSRGRCVGEGGVHEQVAIERSQQEPLVGRPEAQEKGSVQVRD